MGLFWGWWFDSKVCFSDQMRWELGEGGFVIYRTTNGMCLAAAPYFLGGGIHMEPYCCLAGGSQPPHITFLCLVGLFFVY